MKRMPKTGGFQGRFVSFPEPWNAILHPGVRLCLGEPVEVLTSTSTSTSFSRYCVPVYTLLTDVELTKKVKSYAHYFHTIPGRYRPDVVVSYLTLPCFVFALRIEPDLRALVFSSPLSVVEG